MSDDIAIENMVAQFAGQLVAADREPFRRAAAVVLHGCHGEGAAYRALVTEWRKYFRPPSGHVNSGRRR